MRSVLLPMLLAAVVAIGGDIQTADAQQSGNRTVVKVGGTGRADQSKVELAFRRGYFAEQGIDVQIVSGGATAQDYLASVATNQLQVGAGSPNAGMMNALNRGIDIKIVADWARIAEGPDSTLAIIVREDLMASGAVKTVTDLKGKALSAGPGLGSVNEMFLDQALAKGGLKRTDVDLSMLGFSESLAALGTKKLDAAIVIEPMVWMGERQKISRLLIGVGDLDPGAQVAVLFYSPQFAQNKEVATRFMVAYLKGLRDLHEALVEKKNPDPVVDILVEHLPIKDRRVWTDPPQVMTDLNGRVNVAHIKKQAEFYKATGSVTGNVPDIDKHVDMSFADEAVRRIGRR